MSVLSADSKKIFTSVKKLSGWKKDTVSSELEPETFTFPLSPPSLVTLPSAAALQEVEVTAPQAHFTTSAQSPAIDPAYEALCNQVDDVQTVVRQLIEETNKLSKDLTDTRESEKQLEVELAVEKSRNIKLPPSVLSSHQDVSKEQLIGELESEKKLRSELLNSVAMLAQILRGSSQ